VKTGISKKDLMKGPAGDGNTLREETAILRATRRYFENGSGTPAKKNGCEAAIMGAINRYFKVDVTE
jgi:hypothetical protein